MIGSNRTEQSVFMGGNAEIVGLDDAGLNQRLTANWLPEKDRADVIAMYRKLYPGVRNDEILYMATTDRGYFLDSTIQAALKAQQRGAPAFHYQFYRETPVEAGRYHAPHASEIPFISDQMSATWAAFARSGDPNHAGLPNWPAYSAEARPSMIFDIESRVENDPRSEQRQRMLAIGSQQHQGREVAPF
jgi:para-nitrobenzyl esterase